MNFFETFGALYFVPTIIAIARSMRNKGSTIVVNIFLGWTIIGWIVALAMACGKKDSALTFISNPNFPPPARPTPPARPARPTPPAPPAPTIIPDLPANSTPGSFPSSHSNEIKKIFDFIKKNLIYSSVALLILVGIVAFGVYNNVASQSSGPTVTFNITGEEFFGSKTSPEKDDISYVAVKKLKNAAGEISYYLVLDVTNYSSKKSDYVIAAALVCDGFTKHKEELKISGLLPSERKHFESRIVDVLAVDECVASIEVVRDATL